MYLTDADLDFAHAHNLPVMSYTVGRDSTGATCYGGPGLNVKRVLASIDLARFEAAVVDALTATDYPAEWVREDIAKNQATVPAMRVFNVATQMGARRVMEAMIAARCAA